MASGFMKKFEQSGKDKDRGLKEGSKKDIKQDMKEMRSMKGGK